MIARHAGPLSWGTDVWSGVEWKRLRRGASDEVTLRLAPAAS
jgi:hypothetical protein